MDKDSKQVVVLLTHPNIKESRANKALMDAISDMGEVAIYNLYEMRVEDAFNAEIWSTIISHASALVFQFPFYWMSAPSLLKRFLYRLAMIPMVFTMAVAFFVIHGNDPFATKELAFVYLVVFILMYIIGPGKFAVDRWIRKALFQKARK